MSIPGRVVPLPAGWEALVDASGRIFFVNHISKQTSTNAQQIYLYQDMDMRLTVWRYH
jgi:hypothetical protein